MGETVKTGMEKDGKRVHLAGDGTLPAFMTVHYECHRGVTRFLGNYKKSRKKFIWM